MDEGATSLSSSLFSSAQFNQVVFHNLVDCYPGGSDLECTYSVHGEIQHSEKDQVGVFQVGWQSISDAHSLQPAPKPSEPIWFNGNLLPKDGKMYQLCYVTEQGMIAGASVPFFFQSPDDSEWVAVENSDDDFVTVERNFSAMQSKNAKLTLENQQLKEKLIQIVSELQLAQLGQLNDKAPELTKKQLANFQLMCDLQKYTRPGKVISTPLENHFVAPKPESSFTTAKNEPAFLQKGSEDAIPETKDSHNEICELAKSQPDNHQLMINLCTNISELDNHQFELMLDIFNCTQNPEPKKSQPDNFQSILDLYHSTKILEPAKSQPDNHQFMLDLNKREKIPGLAKLQPDIHQLKLDLMKPPKIPGLAKSQSDNHQFMLDLNKCEKIPGLAKLQPDIHQLKLDLMKPPKIPGPAKSQVDNYQLMLDLSKITKSDCRSEDDPSTEIFESREEQPKDDILEAEEASSVSNETVKANSQGQLNDKAPELTEKQLANFQLMCDLAKYTRPGKVISTPLENEQPKDHILEAVEASSVLNETVKANPASQEDSRRTFDETTKDSQNNQAALNSLPLTDKANWFCNGGEHHVGLSCNLSWLKNFMVEEYNIPEQEVSIMIDSFCQEFERLRSKLISKEQEPLKKEDTNVMEQAIWPLNTRNFPSSSTYLSLIRNFMVEEYGMPEQDVLPMINSFYQEIETLRRKFNSKEQEPLEKEGANEKSNAEAATIAETDGSSSTSTSTDDLQEVSETTIQPTTSGSEVKCDAQGFKCGDDYSNPSPPMGESSNTAPRIVRRPWLNIARRYNGPRPFIFGRMSREQEQNGLNPVSPLTPPRRFMHAEKIQELEAEIAGLQSYIQELESTKQPTSAERGDHLDDIVLVLSDELAKVELENKKLKETVDRFVAGSTERLGTHSTEQRGTSVVDSMEQRGSVTDRESLVNKATQSEEEGVPETFQQVAQNYIGNFNLGWRNRSLIGCLNDVRTPLHAVLSQPVVPGTRFEFQVKTLPRCKNFTIKLAYDQSRFPLQATISSDMIDLSCKGSSLYGEKHDLPQDLCPDTVYALIFVVNPDSIEITIQSHSGATLYWNEYRPAVPVTEIQYVHVDGDVVVSDAMVKEADNACCLEMRERLRRAFIEYVDLSYRCSVLKSKLASAQKKDL